MPKLGLIGYPLEHSLSPEIFGKRFDEENRSDFSYELFPIKNIKEVNKLVKAEPDLLGFNVTAPYKKDILPHLYEIDKDAIDTWAVNTVQVTRFKGRALLKGFNTDLPAFEESIKPLLKERHRKALVLGNGGAAAAAKLAFKRLGIDVTSVSRQIKLGSLVYDELDEMTLMQHKIVVNCTPVGTSPKDKECPKIPYQYLTEAHLVYDMVYNPSETLFMTKASEQGAEVKNGREMLELQAQKAWEVWTN